jgi:hypothetical protein
VQALYPSPANVFPFAFLLVSGIGRLEFLERVYAAKRDSYKDGFLVHQITALGHNDEISMAGLNIVDIVRGARPVVRLELRHHAVGQ